MHGSPKPMVGRVFPAARGASTLARRATTGLPRARQAPLPDAAFRSGIRMCCSSWPRTVLHRVQTRCGSGRSARDGSVGPIDGAGRPKAVTALHQAEAFSAPTGPRRTGSIALEARSPVVRWGRDGRRQEAVAPVRPIATRLAPSGPQALNPRTATVGGQRKPGGRHPQWPQCGLSTRSAWPFAWPRFDPEPTYVMNFTGWRKIVLSLADSVLRGSLR